MIPLMSQKIRSQFVLSRRHVSVGQLADERANSAPFVIRNCRVT